MRGEKRQAFVDELGKNERDLNLAYAALLISEQLTHPFDTSLYLSALDDIAEFIGPFIHVAGTEEEIIEVLNRYLFTDLKFIGNTSHYYHPYNSFLDKVIDMRAGIPISLSLLYLSIGWRLGLPVQGIGLPRHFIVAYQAVDRPFYIDVFNRGRLLNEAACMRLARLPASYRPIFREKFLRPATKKEILYRMLLNLKQIYVSREAWEAAYKTVDLMLIVRPDQADEYRDRGLIAYRLNRLRTAAFDIQRYLFLAPTASDVLWLEKHLDMMEERLSRLN